MSPRIGITAFLYPVTIVKLCTKFHICLAQSHSYWWPPFPSPVVKLWPSLLALMLFFSIFSPSPSLSHSQWQWHLHSRPPSFRWQDSPVFLYDIITDQSNHNPHQLISPWEILMWFWKCNLHSCLLIGIFKSSDGHVLRWMPQDLTDDKSTLVQVMAWCRQATSHYLNQCWPRSPTPYGVTRPQWVNAMNRNWWL